MEWNGSRLLVGKGNQKTTAAVAFNRIAGRFEEEKPAADADARDGLVVIAETIMAVAKAH